MNHLKMLPLLIGSILLGCSNNLDRGRDKGAENRIMEKISGKRSMALRVSEIIGNDASRVCLQGKYTPQKDVFEKAVGRPVDGYQQIGEGQFVVWWIFDKSDRSYWVEIPDAVALMSREIESICHNAQDVIHFYQDGNSLVYTLKKE